MSVISCQTVVPGPAWLCHISRCSASFLPGRVMTSNLSSALRKSKHLFAKLFRISWSSFCPSSGDLLPWCTASLLLQLWRVQIDDMCVPFEAVCKQCHYESCECSVLFSFCSIVKGCFIADMLNLSHTARTTQITSKYCGALPE